MRWTPLANLDNIGMQQYQVPQFINVEDRIIGPLTLKQFLYFLGAAGVGILGWRFLYLPLFIIIAVPLIGFFAAMAIGKVDERPLPTIFANALNYFMKPHLYLWKQSQEDRRPTEKQVVMPPEESPLVNLSKLSESKLSDLAWSLDIKEKVGR